MPKKPPTELTPTFSEARQKWINERSGGGRLADLEGCVRHATLTCWNDPRTGRLVFTVETVSQYPRIEQVIGETVYVQETGPFSSEEIYRAASLAFRTVVEQRYGPLR